MRKTDQPVKRRFPHGSGTGPILFAGIAGICITAMILAAMQHNRRTSFTPTPWASIGGCGAGGSGGASGATAKWIGQGVSGGLLDVQAMFSSSATRKSISRGLETRFSLKPSYTSTVALTIPFLSKTGAMQVSTVTPETHGIVNNGLGDMRIDYIKNFGLSGEFSSDFTLTLPTGDYAAATGIDGNKQYISTNLQLGSGLCNLSLDLGYTKDVNDDILLFDLIYSYPFMVNFYGKNQFISSEQDKFQTLANESNWSRLSDTQKQRFEYYFKPYGENDLGGYTPSSITGSVFYGYKGMENFVHSFGLMFSAPLGVAWIPNFDCGSYYPKPDPDHQAWSATLCYGLEFSMSNFPIFVAAYLPIHDKTASATNAQDADPFDTKTMAQWNAPDWDDIFHRWSIFIGTKTTFF
jgi:hypothetical protein